jgi:hypothetical protein
LEVLRERPALRGQNQSDVCPAVSPAGAAHVPDLRAGVAARPHFPIPRLLLDVERRTESGEAMSVRVSTGPGVRPLTNTAAYKHALAGALPADALETACRERLVTTLTRRGWTDTEIACWTRMTTYTTARIRSRLGLAANTINKGAA